MKLYFDGEIDLNFGMPLSSPVSSGSVEGMKMPDIPTPAAKVPVFKKTYFERISLLQKQINEQTHVDIAMFFFSETSSNTDRAMQA